MVQDRRHTRVASAGPWTRPLVQAAGAAGVAPRTGASFRTTTERSRSTAGSAPRFVAFVTAKRTTFLTFRHRTRILFFLCSLMCANRWEKACPCRHRRATEDASASVSICQHQAMLGPAPPTGHPATSVVDPGAGSPAANGPDIRWPFHAEGMPGSGKNACADVNMHQHS